MSKLRVGQRVRIATGTEGIIRFLGETDFKEGEWVGLELDEPKGKNNGTVAGKEYFVCDDNHGMFMRPLPTIEVLEQPKPAVRPAARPSVKPSSSSSSRLSTVGAPSSSRSRTSMAPPPPKRQSVAPSSSTSLAAKRLSNPPPTVGSAARGSRLSVASRSVSPRKSTAPPSASSSARQSMTGPRAGLRSPISQSSQRSSPGIDRILSPGSSTGEPKSTTARQPPASPASSRPSAQQNKIVEDLTTKVQFLEKKREEDREKIQRVPELEERINKHEMVRQKLEAKCKTFHDENSGLKKQLKSLEDQVEQLEALQAEHDSVLELATLDREMAEEQAEAYKTELEGLRSRVEELELDNEILRDENEEFSKDMSPEEKTTKGWLQMERENQRIKEALVRLRDITQDQEEELREEIKELQEDSKELVKLREAHERDLARKVELESDNEDLREQLDAALGAETLIDELTEKTMKQDDQIKELRITVEELQELIELNDQIEENQEQHARDLQQEVDLKDTMLSDMERMAARQEEELNDKEYTISRFRELVSTLQGDLEDVRASKEISELETQNLENSSRAIMDLNRQLQATATSATVKTFDIELRKLEAEQAADHLAIVQLFVSESFQAEKDGILAYLRFKRVGFKARLLHSSIKQRIDQIDAGRSVMDLAMYCEALEKLVWVGAMSARFTSRMETSTMEEFAHFDSMLHEVEPVERTLNGYIDNVKKDELQVKQMVDGLQRSIAVMKHLGELHLTPNVSSFADEVLMRALMVQSNLENATTILTRTRKDILGTFAKDGDSLDEDMVMFQKSSDNMISSMRSAKVVALKLHHVLQDMQSRSLVMEADNISKFDTCNEHALRLLEFSQLLAKATFDLLHQEHEDSTPTDFLRPLRLLASQYFHVPDPEIFSPALKRVSSLSTSLSDLQSLAADLAHLREFEKPPPPWLLRSKDLQNRKASNASASEEIANLKRELAERATALMLRAQSLEEANMKIELLTVRNRDANKKLDRITALEEELGAAETFKKRMEKKVDEQTQLALRFEEERDRWMRKAIAQQPIEKIESKGGEMVGTAVEMNMLRGEIKVLQATNVYLRKECRRREAEEEMKRNGWLNKKLSKPVRQDKERESLQAVLRNIALLPKSSQALRLEVDVKGKGADGKENMKKERKRSVKTRLIDEEMHWVSAWEPMGMGKKSEQPSAGLVQVE